MELGINGYGISTALRQLLSAVHTARKKLAIRPGGCRGRRSRHKPTSGCRDYARWLHDFDDGEVVGVRPEAALRPPFPAGEAAGHDPAVVEPYAVQCPRHNLCIVTVPAFPRKTCSEVRVNAVFIRHQRKMQKRCLPVHRRVHDDDVGTLADPLEVGDLQRGDLRLGSPRVAHHVLYLFRKLFQPE